MEIYLGGRGQADIFYWWVGMDEGIIWVGAGGWGRWSYIIGWTFFMGGQRYIFGGRGAWKLFMGERG